MDEHLKYYLENTAVTKSAMESRLTHPITKLRYPTRLVYEQLQSYVRNFFESGSEPRLVSLAGLRGVGKTTLLWQVAQYTHQKHHKNMYFFNVNTLKNLGVDLHIALEEFQRHIIKKRFNELTEPIALFFDEVHDDQNWSRTLKILYDEARTAFILCTGSSALLIHQTADLTRRMRIEKIYPYKFTEFVAAKTYLENSGALLHPKKGLSNDLKEALFYSSTPSEAISQLKALAHDVQAYLQRIDSTAGLPYKDLWQGYINYQNIPSFIFYRDNNIINESILDLFKRVILDDIPKFKPSIEDFTQIERLILRLAGSDEINPEKLAGIVGIKQGSISMLIDWLAKAELLNILLPFGGLDTKIAKNKKAFFMSPSLRSALLSTLYGTHLPAHFKGKLLEDLMVMYLKWILADGMVSFLSRKDQVNPDFVVETREQPILLEMGSGKTSLRQLIQSNVPYRYGLLVASGIKEPSMKQDCIQIPWSWFSLL